MNAIDDVFLHRDQAIARRERRPLTGKLDSTPRPPAG